jgi:integrase
MDPSRAVAFPESAVSLQAAYLRGLPTQPTRRAYASCLDAFGAFLGRGLELASRRDVEAYRAHLEAQHRAPATVAKALAALSGFYRFAVDEGALERNPVERARRPKVPDRSPRRGLSAVEMAAMIDAAGDDTLRGKRDRALLLILALQGWRLAEALHLRVNDLDLEGGHRVATITGKGGRVARVALAAETWAALRAWLDAAAIGTGPVFLRVSPKGHAVPGSAITNAGAEKRVALLARCAGLRHVHPHLFRHGAITEALVRGTPLHQVQDFARHADPRTTRRYDAHRNSLNNPTPHVLAEAILGRKE